ncbi:BMP family ABC transporter substrate-binding protein [Anaerolineales bacterium HSG24]|nr:BMP family ABC transporter substrate-binding protein [Anaerolineales bacterium HSG24]
MSKKIKVGLQLSVGRLGDLSFNDSAYAGLKAAQREYNVQFETVSWQNPTANAMTMRNWAKSSYDLIVAVGYGNAEPLRKVAAHYPNSHFAIVDYVAEGDNVLSAIYREYEGDYVVGVMAGLVTRSQIVGFIGGGVTPIVKRIESGFAQGVKSVDTSIGFISDYVGEFDDPATGRVLAETQYTLGADVIYQVAGRCGLGAIETAKEFEKLIISTGADHSDLAPHSVLTSRIKDVGKPIFDAVEMVIEDRFQGGIIKSYGLADGGIRMASIRPEMFELITPSIQKIMQDIEADMINGKIEVDLDT